MTEISRNEIIRAISWIETEPNAPKHFTKHGNEISRETILIILRQALVNLK